MRSMVLEYIRRQFLSDFALYKNFRWSINPKYLGLFVGVEQGLGKLFQIVYGLSSVLRLGVEARPVVQIFYYSNIMVPR